MGGPPEEGCKEVNGSELIAAERTRQQSEEEEDYDASHDDRHVRGELIDAAMCYTLAGDGISLKGWTVGQARHEMLTFCWPWAEHYCKPTPDPIRNYTIAGALIAAEIDRLLRKKEVMKHE